MWLSSFYEKHNFFFEVKYEEGPQHLFPQVLDKNQIIKKKNILGAYASGCVRVTGTRLTLPSSTSRKPK